MYYDNDPFRSKDIDGRGFSKTVQVTTDTYVVPQWNASAYYSDDYILNIYNYGIIFGDEIHWYEIGTGTPVLKTAVDSRIYENILDKHGLLIRCLNNLGVDIVPERFRIDSMNYSKKAIQEEQERRNTENALAKKELDDLLKKIEEARLAGKTDTEIADTFAVESLDWKLIVRRKHDT